MFDPNNDLLPPSSPTISSVCSSDLDTESTGSFFHDRSTTLGTLMGVTFRPPAHQLDLRPPPAAAVAEGSVGGGGRRSTARRQAAVERRRRRRRWWSLCRDGGARPAASSSLGEFLAVERLSGGDGAAFYNSTAAELEGAAAGVVNAVQGSGGRTLFADGRVLPPSTAGVEEDGGSTAGGVLSRFPVSLTGVRWKTLLSQLSS